MVRVAFVHPDLGIGGAERLVVDAAVGLQEKEHEVVVYTSHWDPSHCFSETKNGTLKILVYGDFLPRQILGRLTALCAWIRQVYTSAAVLYHNHSSPIDLIFCDQVSVVVPLLKLSGARVIFYCHFPDKLLSKKEGRLKNIYRIPLDFLEEYTTGQSNITLVNSKFTKEIFHQHFPTIKNEPKILYPAINFKNIDRITPDPLLLGSEYRDKKFFLSINRFERKKGLKLAIEAFSTLRGMMQRELFESLHLVLAGGYDHRVEENVQHVKELQKIVDDEELTQQVSFVLSADERTKASLLNSCICVLYTPDKEHFGIVPVEAMYAKKPVIAVNSGGPTESIVHEVTGYLCPLESYDFAHKMLLLVNDAKLAKRMGEAGHNHVKAKFSLDIFSAELDKIVKEEIKKEKNTSASFWWLLSCLIMALLSLFISASLLLF